MISAHNNGSQSKIGGCSTQAGSQKLKRLCYFRTGCCRELFFFIPLSTNAPLTSKIKDLFYVSAGDFGESVRNHSHRKLWSGLRPPIWTCRLSCRVRRDREIFSLDPYLDIWYLTYQHAVCSQCPYLIYLTQMLSLQICETYLCPVSENYKREVWGSFFIIKMPKLLFILPPGNLP